MATIADDNLKVVNDSGGEVKIWIKPGEPDEFTTVPPWTNDGESVYFIWGRDGARYDRLTIPDNGSGYVLGAPSQGRIIVLLGGVGVDYDIMISLHCKGRVEIRYKQLSSLDPDPPTGTFEEINGKTVCYVVKHLRPKQNINSIPNWALINLDVKPPPTSRR